MTMSSSTNVLKRKLRSVSARKTVNVKLDVLKKNATVKKATDPFHIKFYSERLGINTATGAMIASFVLTTIILACIIVFSFFVRKLKRQLLFPQVLSPLDDKSFSGLEYIWDFLTKTGPFVAFVNAPVFPGALSSAFYYIASLPGALLHIFDPEFAKPYKIHVQK